jgi:hypothetical protein
MTATDGADLDPKLLETVVRQAVDVAKEYYRITGRPLGVTGEVAE